MAEGISLVYRDAFQHADGYGEVRGRVRRRSLDNARVISGNRFFLVTFGVFKNVPMVWVYVLVQGRGLVDIDGVELKVFFVQEVSFVDGWIIRCVVIDILGGVKSGCIGSALLSVILLVQTAKMLRLRNGDLVIVGREGLLKVAT